MVRRDDGLCWAVVFNARLSPTAAHLATALNELLQEAADARRGKEQPAAGK
jgi:hypothetical protein